MLRYKNNLGTKIMELCLSLSKIGLILNTVGVFLLAFFSVPSTVIPSDGSSNFVVKTDDGIAEINKLKYKISLWTTRASYTLIGIGFILQIV